MLGGHTIPGYTGLVHWEPGHVHVWCTTNTKYIGINDIMDHTSFAITAVHEGTRLYLFIVFPADPDRKKQMDSRSKGGTGRDPNGPKPTLMDAWCTLVPATSVTM